MSDMQQASIVLGLVLAFSICGVSLNLAFIVGAIKANTAACQAVSP